jgi:hypothetical protein
MNSSVRELVESNYTTNWNGDCCSVAVEFNTCFNQERDGCYSALIGMDASSTEEYVERASPSKKNLSSVLLQLPPVSYHASHAAARSFDYEFSLGINTTVFYLDYDHFIIRVLLAKFDAAVGNITIPSKGSKLPYDHKSNFNRCTIFRPAICCPAHAVNICGALARISPTGGAKLERVRERKKCSSPGAPKYSARAGGKQHSTLLCIQQDQILT